MLARVLRSRRVPSVVRSNRIGNQQDSLFGQMESLEQRTLLSGIIAGILPPNNAHVLADVTRTATPGTGCTFAAATFTGAFTDADGNALTKVQIVSLPTNGQLLLGTTPVTTGQEIDAANLGNLKYRPYRRYELQDSFQWNAADSTEYAANAAQVTLNVTGPVSKSMKATEYFPLTSTSWSYALSQSGSNFTCNRSVTRTKVAGQTGYIVKDSASSGYQTSTQSRTYTLSSTAGLRLYGQTNTLAKTTLKSPLTVLKGVFKVGDTVRWSGVGITGSVNAEGRTIKATGTDTGYSRILGAETTQVAGITFFHAIKTTVVHTQTLHATLDGVAVTLTAQITETAWLVRDVGMIRGTGKVVATLKAAGYGSERETISSSYMLTNSNRVNVGYRSATFSATPIAKGVNNDLF